MHNYSRPEGGRDDAPASHCRGEERQQGHNDRVSWRKHRPFYVLSAKESSWFLPNVSTEIVSRNMSSPSDGRVFVGTAAPTVQLSHENVRPHSRYAQHRPIWVQQRQNQRCPGMLPDTTFTPLVVVVGDTMEACPAHGRGSKKQGIREPPVVCMPEVILDADTTHARRKVFGNSWSVAPRERGLNDSPRSSSLLSGQPWTQLDRRSTVAPCVDGEVTAYAAHHKPPAAPLRAWSHSSSPRITGSARSRIQPQEFHHRLMEIEKQSMAKLVYGIP
ncbi:uncharacterized protein TM35_000152210 [Trypanosoma theileri]|uniref:Uncharacterized protein n=1 Tax=Trypanosoma theileri TaxID=67003 RepID=A0A1X0NXD9_9TRYP|nr:uncharacterized protein TM35_000152210 [Trypanosoma theileri]ORC88790.1 hypothetical protein TM35_000152210 [Trypanosoma theileri]